MFYPSSCIEAVAGSAPDPDEGALCCYLVDAKALDLKAYEKNNGVNI